MKYVKSKVREDSLAFLEQQERQAQQDLLVPLDLEDLLERLVPQDLQEKEESQV